jgi:hypothetical protein
LINLIDFVYAAIPLQVQNPLWELATINLMLANVWFFFVAFSLILVSYVLRYRLYRQSDIQGWELILFRGFRWLAVLISVLCLLMAPLILVDTQRVNLINNLQIDEASKGQLAQLTEAERRLGEVSDLSQLRGLLGQNASIPEGSSLADQKARLQADLRSRQDQVAQQAQTARRERKFALLKSSSRNFLAALVAAFGLGFMVWNTRKIFL